MNYTTQKKLFNWNHKLIIVLKFYNISIYVYINVSFQIPCETANFPSIITPELLELDVDWDAVKIFFVSIFSHVCILNFDHVTLIIP